MWHEELTENCESQAGERAHLCPLLMGLSDKGGKGNEWGEGGPGRLPGTQPVNGAGAQWEQILRLDERMGGKGMDWRE